jgi:hypothetical protein
MANKTLHSIISENINSAYLKVTTLPGHLSSSRYSVGFVMLDIIFYVELHRSLFVILYFFFIPIVLCPSSIYSFDIYKFSLQG